MASERKKVQLNTIELCTTGGKDEGTKDYVVLSVIRDIMIDNSFILYRIIQNMICTYCDICHP